MIATPLLGVTFLFALGNWVAVGARKRVPYEYLTKPGTMILLIVWFIIASGLQPGSAWFLAALIFSLAGDVFLMLPGDLFLPGLGSFLLAQISYIIGFNQNGFPLSTGMIAALVVIAIVAFFVFRAVLGGVSRQADGRKLLPGVLVYALALTGTMISAVANLFRPEWAFTPALLAALGGILFFSSDSILAYDRFVRKQSNAHLLVMITYHLAQFGLISGVVLHLLQS
jgi:uncharacterized membrane protein YhhN